MDRQRHLGGYFRAISTALSQQMQQNCETLGLTATQSMFLHHLWYREHILCQPTYAKDLERFFEIRHPTVSGILQRMEAAGFLTMEASATDRRCRAIHLTEKAEAAQDRTEQYILETEALLLHGMTPGEVEEFRRLLQLSATNLGVFCDHVPPKPSKEVFTP